MHVLIIGGTAYFGTVIVETLLDAGHRVTVFTRGNQRPPFWERVEHVAGDRTNPDDFVAKMRGRSFDAVIDNIAFKAAHVSSALEALRGNIGRYVLTSSTAVYWSGSFVQPLTEGDVDHTVDESSGLSAYELGKVKAEQVLFEQDQVPFTIIRPPLVLGPQEAGSIFFYVQRLLDGGPIILSNGGVQSIRHAFWRDVAAAYPLTLASERAVNQAYNVAQRETVSLVDWLGIAAAALEVEPDVVGIPAEVLEAAALEYEEPWLFTLTVIPDTTKIQQQLGYRATPLEVWLSEMARWYRDEYAGPDADGYDRRALEIDFARRYRDALSALIAPGGPRAL